MMVSKENVYKIRKTKFKVLFKKYCQICNNYYVNEIMWKYPVYGYRCYWHNYICLSCTNNIKDVIKFIEKRPKH